MSTVSVVVLLLGCMVAWVFGSWGWTDVVHARDVMRSRALTRGVFSAEPHFSFDTGASRL